MAERTPSVERPAFGRGASEFASLCSARGRTLMTLRYLAERQSQHLRGVETPRRRPGVGRTFFQCLPRESATRLEVRKHAKAAHSLPQSSGSRHPSCDPQAVFEFGSLDSFAARGKRRVSMFPRVKSTCSSRVAHLDEGRCVRILL